MERKRKIAICLVVCVGVLLPTHIYGIGLSLNSTWGQSGYVSDYYYGEQQHFQMDDNMFQYGESFVQDMSTTSCMEIGDLSSGQFYTAASDIEAGSTIDGYQHRVGARSFGGWAPPVSAPIGDGWDVYALLALLAIGYGVYVYKQNRKTIE